MNNNINPASARMGGLKAIIFDLGNVWVDFDHMIAAKKVSRFTERSPREIFDLFFDSGLTQEFEEGRSTPINFFLAVQDKLNLNISYNEFLPIWNEIFFLTDKNIKVHNLARQLKQNYIIAMISNINVLHFEYLKNKFPVFGILDNIILSYQEHLRKPDHKIYKKTLQILNLLPFEVVYTDDREEFTEEASKLGIRSFHFQGIDKLRKDFLSLGINVGQ